MKKVMITAKRASWQEGLKVETAMVQDTDGAEYREVGGAEAEGLKVGGADNNPKGLKKAHEGAEKTEGYEGLLQLH